MVDLIHTIRNYLLSGGIRGTLWSQSIPLAIALAYRVYLRASYHLAKILDTFWFLCYNVLGVE